MIVGEKTKIRRSFIMGNNYIGKNVSIINTIVDTGIYIPDNTVIGFDKDADMKRKFTISKK